MSVTEQQLEQVRKSCREVFVKKLHDYGVSWRLLRPSSVTDQIFIKANRIRSIETKGEVKIKEGIREEFLGIVNYGVIGLIQLSLPLTISLDINEEDALRLYDENIEKSIALLSNKNHDYDEAWRSMRISSYTDLILVKILRVKQIENLHGRTLISEGIDANYMDMINYSLFGLIRMDFPDAEAMHSKELEKGEAL